MRDATSTVAEKHHSHVALYMPGAPRNSVVKKKNPKSPAIFRAREASRAKPIVQVACCAYPPPHFPRFLSVLLSAGCGGTKMGGLRDDPEFWRLQAEDAKKGSQPEIAGQYERIARRVEERLNDLEKRAPAVSALRKVSMRTKKPGLKSA